MKKLILIIIFLTGIYQINAQRYKEIIKWEVPTKTGGILFGISHSKADAKYIIEDFKERNKRTKYDITDYQPVYMFTTIKVENYNDDPVKIFKKLTQNKGYRVFAKEDLESLTILKKSDLQTAAKHYSKSRNVSLDYALNRVTEISTLYTEYRILYKYLNSISKL